MIIAKEQDLEAQSIDNPEVRDVRMKVLISPENGWKDHVMRLFEVGQGGHTPRHVHAWPHINYIIAGQGILHMEGRDEPIEAGSYAYVPENKLHQFKNTGTGALRFICIVPQEGHTG